MNPWRVVDFYSEIFVALWKSLLYLLLPKFYNVGKSEYALLDSRPFAKFFLHMKAHAKQLNDCLIQEN